MFNSIMYEIMKNLKHKIIISSDFIHKPACLKIVLREPFHVFFNGKE